MSKNLKLVKIEPEDAKTLAVYGLTTRNLKLKAYIESLLKDKAKSIRSSKKQTSC